MMKFGKRYQKTFTTGKYKGCVLYYAVGKYGYITTKWLARGKTQWTIPPKDIASAIDLFHKQSNFASMSPTEFVHRMYS